MSSFLEHDGGVMGDLTRGERLQIMLTAEELTAVDNWRFSRRMPSRASAVRELLKRGLVAEGFSLAEQGSHSKDFGVVNPPSTAVPSEGT
jgi:hypothetical protein